MCDYSLQNVKSRPASVGDKLITTNFSAGTRGFAGTNDCNTAVCVLPGTELAFDTPLEAYNATDDYVPTHNVAIFRQTEKDDPWTHHDALELPDGRVFKLTFLKEGQTATVLQLPAAPKNETEAKEQQRLEVVA